MTNEDALIALTLQKWRKASKSNGQGGGCVEIGWCPGYVGIRDTKRSETSPTLVITNAAFARFRNNIKNGNF